MILDNYYKVSHKQFQPMYKVQVHLTQTEWLCPSCTPPPAKKANVLGNCPSPLQGKIFPGISSSWRRGRGEFPRRIVTPAIVCQIRGPDRYKMSH